MSAGEGPPPESPAENDDDEDGLLRRFLTADSGPLMFAREMLTSIATVAAVGLLLFALSGVWPPMVAVESGSMNPNMQKGDLIFVTEPGRFAPDAAQGDTGVVTHSVGEEVDYRTFNDYGTVVVYDSRDPFGPPIIHRARFWVDEGENWYDQANPAWAEGAENCEQMDNCPAPHAGFITKGDNNPYYDQTRGISPPVKEEWLIGTARVRVPYLGWVRLGVSGAATAGPEVGDAAAEPPSVEMVTDGGVTSATTVGPAVTTNHSPGGATTKSADSPPPTTAPNATASGGTDTPVRTDGQHGFEAGAPQAAAV